MFQLSHLNRFSDRKAHLHKQIVSNLKLAIIVPVTFKDPTHIETDHSTMAFSPVVYQTFFLISPAYLLQMIVIGRVRSNEVTKTPVSGGHS